MSGVLKLPKFFQVSAALIDRILLFRNLLLVFAGLNAPAKKSSFYHQSDTNLSLRARPFSSCTN